MKQLRKVDGTFFASENLPKFHTLEQVVEELASRGIPLNLEKLTALVNAGRIPCFYIDGDMATPFFRMDDVKGFLLENMLWRRDAVTSEIKVYNLSPNTDTVAAGDDGVPAELCGIKALYELKQFPLPAVYFLVWNERVVYVGQSKKLTERINQHRADKQFDRVFYMLVPEHDLDRVELSMIKALKPLYNKSGLLQYDR